MNTTTNKRLRLKRFRSRTTVLLFTFIVVLNVAAYWLLHPEAGLKGKPKQDIPWFRILNDTIHRTPHGHISGTIGSLLTVTQVALERSQNKTDVQSLGKNASIPGARHRHIVSENTSRFLPLTQAASVWPKGGMYDDDRILAQMTFKPQVIRTMENMGQTPTLKKIVVHSAEDWGVDVGPTIFLESHCPVRYCDITDDERFLSTADVVLFKDVHWTFTWSRPSHQVWVLYILESPAHYGIQDYPSTFNWTATYRRDSTIVTPYEKFVQYDDSSPVKSPNMNYAQGKSKMVAWFVSNCHTPNSREKYVQELSKYIQVDIYGGCGNLTCEKDSEACMKLLDREYKFYLAFENSNCKDYITEKFFVTGLQTNVIPVVMGASAEDYKRVSPPHSFIHVDDFESPRHLAEYLHTLDNNDTLYNEFLQWKGTGFFINTKFWCRLCALLHDTSHPPTWYTDISQWWQGPGVCVGSNRWKPPYEGSSAAPT